MRRFDRFVRIVALCVVLAPGLACSQDPETAKREHLAKGDQYVEQKKLREAVIEYKNAVKVDASFGDARFKLATTYEQLGDLPNVYREFVRAADLLPGREDVQLKAARYLVQAGRHDDAKRIVDGLLKKDAKNVEAHLIHASTLAAQKDVPGAIAELELAKSLDPKRIDTYLNLAGLALVTQTPAQAETILREAITVQPESIDARLGLANIRAATGDLPGAEALLKEALTRQPTHAAANRTLAVFYQRTGRVADAEVPLRRLADASKSIPDRFTLAEYYLGTGKTAEATAILTALEKEPEGHVPAALLLVQSEYVSGQRDAAHKRLDDLLAKETTNARALLLKSRLLAGEGKFDDALARAQAAAAAAPRFAEAQYAIGLISLQKKDREQALKAFNEVLKLDPNATDATFQIAKLQLASGQADTAQKSLEDVVKKQPGNLDARLTLARAWLARGDVAKADAEVTFLATQVPKSAEVQALVGSVAALKKDLPGARAAYTRALELDGNSIAALAGLVGVDLASGKPAEAKARVTARLAAAPDNPAVLEFAGRAYIMLGDLKTAEQTWRKLIAEQPASLNAYAALGRIFVAQGRLDEARQEFERFSERKPTDVGAHTMVGMLLQAQNRPDEAQKRYERAVEIDRNAAVAANNLAWMYAERNGNLDVALQLAQTAKRQLTESPEVDDTLGWVYYKKGLATLAIASFTQSATKAPANPGHQYHLGLAYLKNGDKTQAKQALQKAIALKTDFDGADDARKILAGLK